MASIEKEVALLQAREAQSKTLRTYILIAGSSVVLFVIFTSFVLTNNRVAEFGDSPASFQSKTEDKNTHIASLNRDVQAADGQVIAAQEKSKYEGKLLEFTEALRPNLESMQHLAWSRERASELLLAASQSITLYEQAKFSEANKVIQGVIVEGKALIGWQREEFDALRKKLMTALVESRTNAASRYAESLTQIFPTHPDIGVLQDYSKTLGEALMLTGDFESAKASNSLNQALSLGTQLLKLQPYQPRWKDEVDRLNTLINSRRSDKLGVQIEQLVSSEKIGQALELLENQGSKIFSEKKKRTLEGLIVKKKREIDLRFYLDEAEKAEKADKWSQAIVFLKKANDLDPENIDISERNKRALEIIRHADILQKLVDSPLNLSDPKVLEFSKQQLASGKVFQGDSQTISKLSFKLNGLLDKANTPREVMILSDGLAKIEVQTVGFIKPTLEKRIKLKPGRYRMFASCRNRTDQIFELIVPLDDPVKPMRIRCGERI